MGPRPQISVLLPVFNGGDLLALAVESVLRQSFQDFELLIIDDGSTDATEVVLRRYSGMDARIRVIRHEKNLGLVSSLNHGLEECRAPLVARLDADDVALPTRLGRQLLMFRNPGVVLSATAYRRVTVDRALIRVGCPPRTHGEFVALSLTGNRLNHSTVMYRRSAVQDVGGYDASWFPVEDFDLWLRLSRVGQFAGIGTVEAESVESPHGISATLAETQEAIRVRRVSLERSRWGIRDAESDEAGRRMVSFRDAYRSIRADLVARRIDTVGLSHGMRTVMMADFADMPRARRHALAWSRAPRVAAAVPFPLAHRSPTALAAGEAFCNG